MKKSKLTEEQIAYAFRLAESGTPVLDACRKLGVSEQTFYRWKKKYEGIGWQNSAAFAIWRMKTAGLNL
jgi:putative transposase